MDREGADFDGTLEEIGQRLNANPVALQIPVGAGPPHINDPFRGVIDLIEMKMLVFDPQTRRAGDPRRRRSPRTGRRRPQLWRDTLLEKLYAVQRRADGTGPAGAADPRGTDPPGAPRGDASSCRSSPCSAARPCTASACSRCWTRVAWYLPSPLDMPPVEGINPKKKDASGTPQARTRRAVLRPGLQDPARQDRRPVLGPRLLRRAEGQQPRAESRQGQEGERLAAVADPGHQAGEQVDHALRPATSSASSACGTRSPATRSATRGTRSCWSRSSSPRR